MDRAPVGRGRALALLALALVLSMTTWFSATAVVPQLRAEWALGDTAAAWLTIAVQLGFVTGALVSASQAVFLVPGQLIDDSFIAFGGGISSRVSDWVSINASVETDFQRDFVEETRVSLGARVDF